MTRKAIAALLIIAMIMGLSAPAYAMYTLAEVPEQRQEQPQSQAPEQEETPVVVSTLEELQAAVAAAEDGDIITLDDTIIVSGVALQTDKQITLVRSEEHAQSAKHMLILKNGGSLSGFDVFESGIGHTTIFVDESTQSTASISDCIFSANKECPVSAYIHCQRGNNFLSVSHCTFNTGNGYSIYVGSDTEVTIDSCTFQKGHYFSWFLICADGNTTVQNCTFSEETGYIVSSVFGVLTVIDCDFEMNIAEGRVYPNIYIGGKDLSGGTLNISNIAVDGVGFYDLFTGEKVDLPLTDCVDETILAHMTDEYAEQYFQRKGITDRFPFSYDERNEKSEDEPTSDDETPTEPPTTPSEQPNDDNRDNTPNDQQQPSEPQEQPNDDDNADISNDDNEPEIIYRPIYVRVPVYVEHDSELEKPSLVCGDAAIDVSRSVVLEGYTDGLLHLEDSLTRAQFAKILYGLLDEDTIERYKTPDTVFADVAPDAWHCPYVNSIAKAGIVCGTGNGNFDPEAQLTWAHIITVLSRFVEPQEYQLQNIQYNGWAVNAVETAVALGWIADQAGFDPDAAISRGELTYFVNYVLGLYR